MDSKPLAVKGRFDMGPYAVCRGQDAQLEQGQRLLRRMRYERKLLRYCQKKAGRMGREFMVLHWLITFSQSPWHPPLIPWFLDQIADVFTKPMDLWCDIEGQNALFHRFR